MVSVINKVITEEEVITQIEDGMTIGVGGWGSRRKPMSLIMAIIRSGVKNLTIVSYGGPEIGLLSATGQLKRAIYGFVSLDSIPLEPHFRIARQTAEIEVEEFDEGAFYLGLMAAAHRVPFYPTRAGLGSDMLKMNPNLKLVQSPYPDTNGDYEELVAIPAFDIDISLISTFHVFYCSHLKQIVIVMLLCTACAVWLFDQSLASICFIISRSHVYQQSLRFINQPLPLLFNIPLVND